MFKQNSKKAAVMQRRMLSFLTILYLLIALAILPDMAPVVLAAKTEQQTNTIQTVKPQLGPDTDNDWVSDADEQRFGSDPDIVDSDSDGMSDFEEIFMLHTNPANADKDSDGDSFFDQVEQQLFKTNPNEVDGDQDGDLVPDKVESSVGSDLHKIDSDQDLISDFIELFLLKSSPNKPEPDGDKNGYPDALQAWLPQHLQKTSCQADITLTVDKFIVIDPEEADSQSNMSGGDETMFIYGLQVSPSGQPIMLNTNGNFDGEVWNGDLYEGNELTDFRPLGPLQAKCGQVITVFMGATESDMFMGETQMGPFQTDNPFIFQRLPVGWEHALQRENVFEGKGVDGTYEYDVLFTIHVALGAFLLQGLPQADNENISFEDLSNIVLPCQVDDTQNNMQVNASSSTQLNQMTRSEQSKSYILFEEGFDDTKGRWTVGPSLGTEIRDGALVFRSDQLPLGIDFLTFPESITHFDQVVAAAQGSFTISFEFFDLKSSPDFEGTVLAMKVATLGINAGHFFAIEDGKSWRFLQYPNGIEETGVLPGAINLMDGKRHTLSWSIVNTSGQSNHIMMVDGQEVAKLTLNFEVHGEPVFGFGYKTAKMRTTSLKVDRFTLYGSGANLNTGAGIGAFTENFSSANKRLRFRHPDGWAFAEQAEPISQVSNGAINNLKMFNSPGGYSGTPNEMALTIYEPVYVMETASIIDSTKVELQHVLYPFVKTELKEIPRSDRPKLNVLEKITVCDKPLVRTTAQVEGNTIIWVASRNSDKTVTITKIQLPAGQLEELMPTPLSLISTLDYSAPPHTVRDLDGPAIAAKEFMIAMTQGNLDDGINMICTPERLFFSIADFFLSDMFNTNVIENLALEGYKLDDSYRYYETVWTGKDDEGDESAFIRVSGHIVHIHPDGNQYIVAQSRAPIFGRSTLIRVEKENGVWRVCQGMKFKW